MILPKHRIYPKEKIHIVVLSEDLDMEKEPLMNDLLKEWLYTHDDSDFTEIFIYFKIPKNLNEPKRNQFNSRTEFVEAYSQSIKNHRMPIIKNTVRIINEKIGTTFEHAGEIPLMECSLFKSQIMAIRTLPEIESINIEIPENCLLGR